MQITENLEIPEDELIESYIRSGGPGGQNVNKVATAVQLRYRLRESSALPDHVKTRLLKKYSNRINNAGELIVEARQYRTQAQNRVEARRRMEKLIRSALKPPRS